VFVFVPLSRSLVIVFVSLSYSSRIRIVFARDRMRYVGRPPGTQSQHLVSPLLVGCCRGAQSHDPAGPARATRHRQSRPGPNWRARASRDPTPSLRNVHSVAQRSSATGRTGLPGQAGEDGQPSVRGPQLEPGREEAARLFSKRPFYWGSTRSPEDFKHKATVRSSVFVTRPPALVMGASSSGLRTPDLLPESEPAGPRDLSSTASPRRDATRGSRSRPASRPESEETRPACRWSNPSRPRPALHVTRRREQGGGARAHVTVPEPKAHLTNRSNQPLFPTPLLPGVGRPHLGQGSRPGGKLGMAAEQ